MPCCVRCGSLVQCVPHIVCAGSLVYGVPDAPFSQPRNVIGGHTVSALCGVLCFKLLVPPFGLALALPAAAASSIIAMMSARIFHPPAAATATAVRAI